ISGEELSERTDSVWRLLADVADPEIPALSIVDLGIVRFVRWEESGRLHVAITPTYSGCPATQVIHGAVRRALVRAGYADARTETVAPPPWPSDWLTREGRQNLAAFGIAPPAEPVSSPRRLFGDPLVACPRCGSDSTEKISEFGSTPCKAHY